MVRRGKSVMQRLINEPVTSFYAPNRTMADEPRIWCRFQAAELGPVSFNITGRWRVLVGTAARIEQNELLSSYRYIERRDIVRAQRWHLAARENRIEQSKISHPGAPANFVISPGDDPRSGGEEIFCRREEIGVPRRPVIAVGAALTPIGVAAFACAIKVIADMDDEIGFDCGCSRADLGKGPL